MASEQTDYPLSLEQRQAIDQEIRRYVNLPLGITHQIDLAIAFFEMGLFEQCDLCLDGIMSNAFAEGVNMWYQCQLIRLKIYCQQNLIFKLQNAAVALLAHSDLNIHQKSEICLVCSRAFDSVDKKISEQYWNFLERINPEFAQESLKL